MAVPTTTSFAILCLLAVKPWTAYELAQQMTRSVGNMWPRAASVVYEEPKRLVQLGLASAETRHTGKRTSTVYAITDLGRSALARWLEEPGAAPTIEFEALLKVAFADQGSLEGLKVNLAAIRRQAEEEYEENRHRLAEYAQTGGPYPDRLPVIALAARYYTERAAAMLRWVEWADDAIRDWSGVTTDDGARTPPDAFSDPDHGSRG